MGIKIKDIFKFATDMLPGASVVKSIIKGAGSLLFKKAAKKMGVPEKTVDAIFGEAEKIAENDPEIRKALAEEDQKRREFEMAFFGRAADLSPKAQIWRVMTRPWISWASVGTYLLLHIARFTLLACKVSGVPEVPTDLKKVVVTIIGFWFLSRGGEKIVELIFNRKKE